MLKLLTKLRLDIMLFLVDIRLDIIQRMCHGFSNIKYYYMNCSGLNWDQNTFENDNNTIVLYINCKGSNTDYVNRNPNEFKVMKVEWH